ncbi:MAG: hypothetical protein IH948_06140 [Bacteroidetes bacterium]|nr:hypothetical protein [Bacteroidota bacterium]
MNALLIIIFVGTLVYMAISVNIRDYIGLIALQGVLLFGISLIELEELSITHLLLILAETLVFKAIIVPLFLLRIVKQNKISSFKKNQTDLTSKGFNLVIVVSIVIASCFLFSHYLQDDRLNTLYFSASLALVITGFIFIIVNKNILIHLISFLVIENGVFLLALAVGREMPLLVDTVVLLDIFICVLVIGMFINRIASNFDQLESDQLSELKD